MGKNNTSLDENTIREILGKDYDEYNVSVNDKITENIAAIILEKDGLTKLYRREGAMELISNYIINMLKTFLDIKNVINTNLW